ncbi:MAG: ACP S-malonyltransferase [Anaerocolumna sp.]
MKNIAVLFPGQGSQYVGMYKILYDESSIVRDTIAEAEEVTGIQLRELCFNGPPSKLAKPENAHIAIHAFSVAVFRAFVEMTGFTPKFCAGHSLGEYAALVCAGALRFSDALKLVQLRSGLCKDIQSKSDGGMTIIDGIEIETIAYACQKQQAEGKQVFVSCYNSAIQAAISGTNKDLEDTERLLLRSGKGTMSPLIGSAPFHCPLMESAVEPLREQLQHIETGKFRYPVLSNYTGKPYKNMEELEDNLTQHLIKPVKWVNIISYLAYRNVNLIIDFSANKVFQNMVAGNSLIETLCYGSRRDRSTIQELYQGDLYRKHKSDFISKCILTAVSTPNRNFDQESYQLSVVDNYHELVKLGDNINNKEPKETIGIRRKGMELLIKILDGKKVPDLEKTGWIRQIADENAATYEELKTYHA